MELQIRTEHIRGGIAVVHLHGEILLENCQALRQALDQQRQQGSETVLNLAEISFVDSAGIQGLVDAAYKARQKGKILHLAQMPPYLRRTLKITRLLDCFGVHDTLPAALEFLERAESPD